MEVTLLETIKGIFSPKRIQITLYMAMVLWIAVITQVVVNHLFLRDFQITEAFIKTDMEEMESSLEIIAESQSEFLSEANKKEIILKIANAIDLNVDRDITVIKDGSYSEYSFLKEAKSARSEIKVISLEEETKGIAQIRHYIIIRINVFKSIQSIDNLKSDINKALIDIGVTNKQVTMEFEGAYNGLISRDDKKSIAKNLVKELHGEVILEYEENELFTVYAYTGLINDYIMSLDSKVNIQIAMTYDEELNKTMISLATPILSHDY